MRHQESERHPRRWFASIANKASQAAGRASTFVLACAVVVIWAMTGHLFHFSDTWQLVINTGTTIVTFLMVFLIQNSQNRDSAAIQVRLDELIRTGSVQNSFVGIAHLSADELEELQHPLPGARQGGGGGEKKLRQTPPTQIPEPC